MFRYAVLFILRAFRIHGLVCCWLYSYYSYCVVLFFVNALFALLLFVFLCLDLCFMCYVSCLVCAVLFYKTKVVCVIWMFMFSVFGLHCCACSCVVIMCCLCCVICLLLCLFYCWVLSVYFYISCLFFGLDVLIVCVVV